ncbi:MAG TPA: hypothetical protein VM120_19870, partial [Bryobacteraceae bacterium]|nr:hypothetical protein [Bryobacteraceae bacterium]
CEIVEALRVSPAAQQQSQTRSACNEGHKPFCHRNVLLYSFQQNIHLVITFETRTQRQLPAASLHRICRLW